MEKNKKKSQHMDTKQLYRNQLLSRFKVILVWHKILEKEEDSEDGGVASVFLPLEKYALEMLSYTMVARGKALGIKDETFAQIINDELEDL